MITLNPKMTIGKIKKILRNSNGFNRDLIIVSFGSIISAALFFLYNILIGRLLGPDNYGNYILILSVSNILIIPMILGFNTSIIKYLSNTDDHTEHSHIISTIYLLSLACILIAMVIYLLTLNRIIDIFAIPKEILTLSIIYSGFLTLYNVVTSALRGLFKLELYSYIQIASSIVLLLALVLLYLLRDMSYSSIICTVIITYLLFIIFIAWHLRQYIRLNIDYSVVKLIAKFTLYCIIGNIVYAVYTNVDKILINAYINSYELGIYNTYLIGSINISLIISNIFSVVLFSYASRDYANNNKSTYYSIANKYIPYIAAVIIPLTIILMFVVIKLFGPQYRYDIFLSILFSLASVVVLINSIYLWLMNALGETGIKITTVSATALAVISLFMNLCLIPILGLPGAVISLIVSYSISTIFIRHYFQIQMT